MLDIKQTFTEPRRGWVFGLFMAVLHLNIHNNERVYTYNIFCIAHKKLIVFMSHISLP